MSKSLKIAIILAVAFLINLLISCNCTWPVYESDFHSLFVENLNNADEYPKPTTADTMLSQAVAFRIIIKDTISSLFAEARNSCALGFSAARAFQCACDFEYQAKHQIKNIRITTLFRLSPAIAESSDVTDQFVATISGYYGYSPLYATIAEITKNFGNNGYCDSRPIEIFDIFLRPRVLNTKAQFRISAELSDGRTLEENTRLITILN